MNAGTLTILASDFIGSTPLFEKLGDERGHELSRSLLGILRKAIADEGGREFKSMGDALLVAFSSAVSAVQCAVSMQQAIARRNSDEGEHPLGLAVGLSVGEPIEDDGDYFGSPVTLAVRLSQMAAGGHILVSGALRSVVGSRGGYRWQNLGPVDARGIGPMHAWALLWPGVDEHSSPVRTSPAVRPSPHTRGQPGSRPVATATILFVDVVDSTPITELMGDSAFRARSRDLDRALREAILAEGGIAVDGKVLGDGVMAIFGSASGGIEAALRCREAASATELQLHLGLHAGDVIDEGDNVYGWAVNMASRVCAASAPGEVLVSDTVRQLARASSGVRFEDRGLHELKGIDEPQRLYAVRPAPSP